MDKHGLKVGEKSVNVAQTFLRIYSFVNVTDGEDRLRTEMAGRSEPDNVKKKKEEIDRIFRL